MERCPHCGAPKTRDVLRESKKIIEDILNTPLPPKARRKLKEAMESLRRQLILTREKRERILR